MTPTYTVSMDAQLRLALKAQMAFLETVVMPWALTDEEADAVKDQIAAIWDLVKDDAPRSGVLAELRNGLEA